MHEVDLVVVLLESNKEKCTFSSHATRVHLSHLGHGDRTKLVHVLGVYGGGLIVKRRVM